MRLLRSPQTVAVDCRPEGEFLKVGVLLVKDGATDSTALFDPDTEAAYPVRIPAAGCYYAVLLERLPDAPTL